MSQSPTIGRRLWYRPSLADLQAGLVQVDADQAFDAGVVHVKDAATVTLHVTDHRGNTSVRVDTHLLADGEAAPELGGYCEWMPYQKAQAAASSPAAPAPAPNEPSGPVSA